MDEGAQLLRDSEVVRATGIGRTTRYRMIADGSFPPPIRLSPGRVAWRRYDIVNWLQTRSEVVYG